MKRFFDTLVAATMVVVLSPVMALIGIAVKLSSPGPVLYRGARIGRDGHAFQMLKFRTMTPGTKTSGDITVRGDPRVTPLGRILRASKLDELPQLINVIRGEMSLVGPRPESPIYVAYYTAEQRAVLCVRPGITGLSQVLFRHEEQMPWGADPERYYLDVVMPAKLEIDLEYLRQCSAWRDFWILALTVGALVRPVRLPVPLPIMMRASRPSPSETGATARATHRGG